MNTIEIERRYGVLAEDTCCLSCGSALGFSEVKAGETCVDLGSGRGTDVIRMAQQSGEKGMAIGVDVSEKMISKAEKSATKLNVKNVKFIRSSLEKIDIESDSVDLIISNCTLNHVNDKDSVWSEIYRMLKIGGRFVISDIYSVSEIPEEYSNDPVAVSECWGGAVEKEEYLKILKRAGFKDVKILEESKPYPKGKTEVVSFTIAATKQKKCCCLEII
jgi:ubiquinone/menaquinone biosynthesis C-methylase UbiE